MWGGMADASGFHFSFRFSLGAVLGEIQYDVGEHGSNPFFSLPRLFLGSLFQALLLWRPLCPLSDFRPCVSLSWWFWPHTSEREFRLRLHSKTCKRLLGEAGRGSWWHFVISVSPVICLSLACLVHWVIAWQLWHFRRWSVWLKGQQRRLPRIWDRDSVQGDQTEVFNLPPKEQALGKRPRTRGIGHEKTQRDVSCFKEGKVQMSYFGVVVGLLDVCRRDGI